MLRHAYILVWLTIIIEVGGLAVAFSAPPLVRAGGEWYVSPAGDDGQDCLSAATACATLNGAIGKVAAGDVVRVATGVYTSSADTEVVLVDRSVTLSGGWDSGFAAQTGLTTVDGQHIRRGLTVTGGVTATVDRFVIENGSQILGGGLGNLGVLTVTNSWITGNTAGHSGLTGGGGGGGIMNWGVLTLHSSTVSGNRIEGVFSGSGIANFGTLALNNSTLSGNTGAMVLYNFVGQVSLNSSTIANNTAGIRNDAGVITWRNSVLAGNGYSNCDNNRNGYNSVMTSLGYNLIQAPHNCVLAATDLSGAPHLAALQNNGGAAPTLALLADSPGLNAGNPAGCVDHQDQPLPVDQRGARRLGLCDIGAYEAHYTLTQRVQGVAFPGYTVSLEIQLHNLASNIDLEQMVITDVLPAELTYVPGTLSTSTGQGSLVDNTLVWHGAVFSQTDTRLTFQALVGGPRPASGWITNTVVGTWDGLTIRADLPIDALAHTYLPLCVNSYCPPSFFDDFSNPATGWPIDEDDLARSEYLDSEYRVLSKQSGYLFLYHAPTCGRTNYFVETDARWVDTPGSSYGLLFGINSDFSQYYLFDINTDYHMYRLYRRDSGGFTRLVAPTVTGAIHSGTAANHLKVYWNANAGQITLEVNNSVLGAWVIGSASGLTQAGVIVSPYDDVPAADARFDNFRVTGLGGLGGTELDTAAALGGLTRQPATATHAGLPAWQAAVHPLTPRPTAVPR